MTTCTEKHHPNHPHRHGPNCGHTAIRHDGHVDYLHDGHLHHAHEDHVDEHFIAVDSTNPMHCTPQFRCSHVHGDTKRYRMVTTSITLRMVGCIIPMVITAMITGLWNWPN